MLHRPARLLLGLEKGLGMAVLGGMSASMMAMLPGWASARLTPSQAWMAWGADLPALLWGLGCRRCTPPIPTKGRSRRSIAPLS